MDRRRTQAPDPPPCPEPIGGGHANPLRIGFVGIGRVVERYHLPAIDRAKGWNLVAACDPSPARRLALRKARPRLAIVESLEEMVRKTQLDAVLIATPPNSHAGLAIHALKAGLAVLVEKPFTRDVEESERVRDAVRDSGQLLWVGFNRRFLPAASRIRRSLRGAGGSLDRIEGSFAFPIERWGDFSGYLGDEARSGDALADVGSHAIDLMSWICGERIAEGRAIENGPKGRKSATFELRMMSGRIAGCQASHGHPYHEWVRVPLAEGESVIPLTRPEKLVRPSAADWIARGRRLVGQPDELTQSMVDQWKSFADAIRGEAPADRGATVADGCQTVRAIRAIRQSRESKRGWIRITPEEASSPVQHPQGRGPSSSHLAPEDAETPPEVEMSIVFVVGNQRQRAERTLQTLLAQEEIQDAEIILIDAGPPAGPALAGTDHPSIRLFLQERGPPYGEMRARGARLARGAWLAFIEEHCHALEGWLAAARSAAAGPWDAVGGEMHSANPGVGISDAIAMMNYGTWTPPALGGESSLLPGHNALYRKQVLLAYGRRLGWYLQAEAVFHPRLIRDGYRIGIEPAMKFGHLNETDLAVICRSYLHWHRAFGGFRAEEGDWGGGHRLLRAASTPLVPFVRAGRLFLSCLRHRRQDLRPFLLNLPVILVAQGSAALGLGLGYLFGPGTSAAAFVISELDAERRTKSPAQAR